VGDQGVEAIPCLCLNLNKIRSSRLGTGQCACAAGDLCTTGIQQGNDGTQAAGDWIDDRSEFGRFT
jgi:hypothetical protein